MVGEGPVSDDEHMEPTKETSVSTSTDRSLLTGRLVFRTGIALVLVGLLFLFRYSIERGWFGPTARLTLGAVVSAALVVAGVVAPRKVYGTLLQGAGVAGAYATAWAAYGRYGLVDATTAFVQLALVAAAGVGLAWRERSDALSAVGAMGAVVAPLLIGGRMSLPGEVAYQLAILAVALAVYLVRRWWITLTTVGVGTGAVMAAQVLTAPAGEHTILLTAGVGAWWAGAWAVPVWTRRLGVGRELPTDVFAVATFPVSIVAWTMVAILHGGGAPATTVFAAALAAAHLIAWITAQDRTVSVLDLLVGLGFVGAALLTWLEASTAVPLYLVAAMGVAVWGDRVDDQVASIVGLAAAAVAVPVWGVMAAEGGSFQAGAAASSLAAPVIVATAAMLMKASGRVAPGAVAYWMLLVWIARHPGEIDPGWATAGFAVLGVGTLVAGRVGGMRLLTVAGSATMALAVVKLILSDLASADPMLRIGLALGIGIALVAVGYWIGDADLVARHDPVPEEHEDLPPPDPGR